MSLYQSFAFCWHLDQGDTDAARIVASLPPECFAAFDRMMQAAFILGMSRDYPPPHHEPTGPACGVFRMERNQP